jgi:hypothetical protein
MASQAPTSAARGEGGSLRRHAELLMRGSKRKQNKQKSLTAIADCGFIIRTFSERAKMVRATQNLATPSFENRSTLPLAPKGLLF